GVGGRANYIVGGEGVFHLEWDAARAFNGEGHTVRIRAVGSLGSESSSSVAAVEQTPQEKSPCLPIRPRTRYFQMNTSSIEQGIHALAAHGIRSEGAISRIAGANGVACGDGGEP